LLTGRLSGIILPSVGKGVALVGEVINWEEKYVSYVEGDLRRDIQELKDGQKALDAKIVSEVTRLRTEDIQELKDGQKSLDAKIDNGLKALDAKIEKEVARLRSEDIQELKDGQKSLDAKIDDLRKELSSKIDRMTYIIVGTFAIALIGGLIKLFIG
jgi:uncharacterized phage infection (PIP) family protein YhgE